MYLYIKIKKAIKSNRFYFVKKKNKQTITYQWLMSYQKTKHFIKHDARKKQIKRNFNQNKINKRLS